MCASPSGDSVQTNADLVSWSMTRDYSDGGAAGKSALGLLCGIVNGDDVDATPAERSSLLWLAREHRVQHLLAWRLHRRGTDLHAWFGEAADALRQDVRHQFVVDAVRNEELTRVIAALADADGAMPVLFKGAALAHSHYPESWLRPRLDTDLLISAPSGPGAFEVLRSLGYAQSISTSGELVTYQASFERLDGFDVAHCLDVHWKVANWQAVADVLSHEEIAARAIPLPALGPHARAACASDALVLACLHRAAHHRDSEELLWIYDIHLIARRLSDAEWTAALTIAERGAVKAICERGLRLAIDRFNTPVPIEVMRRLEHRQHGAVREPSSVYLSKNLRRVDGLMSDLRSLPVRAGTRLIAEHLFPPAEYMKKKYGVRSLRSILFAYARRIVAGLPKWFATGDQR
jgi:hypothetical protein